MRSLNHKILLYVLAFWGGVAIVGALGYSRLNAVQKVSHVLLESVAPSAEAALQVENAVHQVLKNTYTYSAYKQPDYRNATQQALSVVDEAFATYQRRHTVTSDETVQKIESLIENVRTHAIDCLQMADNGMTAEEMAPHLDDLKKTQVEAALELREAASREQARMVQGAEEIDRVISQSLNIFIAGTLVLLLVTLGVGYLFSRLIMPPVTGLTSTALRFSAEDLSVRAAEDYPGEFGVLARAFNTMATRIQDTLQENVHLAAFPRENPGLVMESDMEGNITYVNPAAKRVLKNLRIEQAADLLPGQHTGIIHACLKRGQSYPYIDVAVEDCIYSWSYHPIAATGMVHLYGMDVTELKQMEASRRTFERQLIQAERMASVGTVTAGIVHNLRNPLMVIMGFAQLLQMKHPDLSEADRIVSSAEQMTQIIENILAKSRQKKTPESVDLNVLLKQELEFLQADSTFKHEVEKDIRLAEGLPPVQCVYTDFSQVFGNLLRNAVDAMLAQKTKRLTVVTSSDTKQVTVEVTDTGSGIPEGDIPHLFEPFFTTKSPDAEEGGPVGTGLGLYMVHQILEPYGAKVEVESVVDEGTTFRVQIPITVGGE